MLTGRCTGSALLRQFDGLQSQLLESDPRLVPNQPTCMVKLLERSGGFRGASGLVAGAS